MSQKRGRRKKAVMAMVQLETCLRQAENSERENERKD